MARRIGKYSTAAAIEDPINPSIKVNYTQLLIDGKFVDAASGEFSILFISSDEFKLYFPQKFGNVSCSEMFSCCHFQLRCAYYGLRENLSNIGP